MEQPNAVESNPLFELSTESLNKLDEVLNSDSVKQLLSDSKSFENLAAAIEMNLENEAPATSSLSTASTVTTSNSAPGHVATVQEGLDLVDALDSLVNQLTGQPQPTTTNVRTSNLTFPRDVPPEVDLLGGNLEVGSSIEDNWVDSIYLDHSYSCVAVKQKAPNRRNSQVEVYDMSGSSSSPTTPQRRSQRQIEKIEKSVLERIKAENQELLKREREEMGGNVKRVSVSFDEPFQEQEPEEEAFDESLVIDIDDKRQMIKKKQRRKKPMSESSSSAVLTASSLVTQHRKSDDDLENVIAALSGESVDLREDRRSGGVAGRSQRQRRKPKRWDDDEVEVDFSGNASELGMESSSSMKKVVVKSEIESEERTSLSGVIESRSPALSASASKSRELDSDEDDDEDDDWGSDDDPDKLWCICRQPHNNRFMICCDGCEDWFHGTCVGVTKKQGRICEQEKRKWFCAKCKEAGKRDDRMFDPAIHTENELKLKKTKTTMSDETKREEITRKQVKRISDEQRRRNEFRMKMGKPKSLKVPVASAEKKEEEKLKKLIKTKKMEFKKKFKKETSDESKDQKESEWEPISKVVTVVRKPEDKKKKFKDQSIDLSFQDLFKAEPITLKKPGSNSLNSPITPPTPTTPKTPLQQPPLKRPSISESQSSLHHQQRKPSLSWSSSSDQLCISCNKIVHKTHRQTLYCSDPCIEKHVKELTELLKQTRSTSITSKGEKRVVVIERTTGKLLAGGNAILEDKLVDFIKSHPTFEVLKPQTNIVSSSSRKPSVDGAPSTTSSSDQKKKPEVIKSPIKKSEDVKRFESVKKAEDSVAAPKPKPKQASPSDSNSNSDQAAKKADMGADSIRNNVKKALRDTLMSRCNEANDLKNIKEDDIKKIASKVEEEMYQYFNKDTSGKYRTRYRSLVFNLKDCKNQGLFRKVLTGKIEPSRLVRMSPEELASPELAKWRERENKHMLEMIKRDAEQQAQQIIVKKTHKGEVEIETKTKKETENEAMALEKDKEKKDSSSSSFSVDDFQEDTTSKHGQHVFDLRCDICTKQTSKRKSKNEEDQPKRVRVELDEPTNKILQEAVKLSAKAAAAAAAATASSSSSRDSFEQDPTNSSHSSPPPPATTAAQEPLAEPRVNIAPFWKGIICMQDVAKFMSSAFKVSGNIESQDTLDMIQVCGRIAPEQVLDYIKKLKYSSRTEISVIRFIASSFDEKIGYDAFFNYLNVRKRYGVVGNTAKSVKDFYILPLPKDTDPPEVLLPFNGPGLEKRFHRPNLLLGILIKSKKIVEHKSKHKSDPRSHPSSTESNALAQERSYTPPPPLKADQPATGEEEPYDPANSLTPPHTMKSASSSSVSYTPPRTDSSNDDTLKSTTVTSTTTTTTTAAATTTLTTTSSSTTAADEEPYDPEDNSSNSSNLVDLLEKLTKSTNPHEMTSTILSAPIEQQKLLLNELTNKVEESKKQLEEQRKAAEAAFNIATSSAAANKNLSCIPGLDGSFSTSDDSSAQLQIPNIQLPDNLKEILESVQRKTQEQEKHKVFDDPIVKTYGDEKLDDLMDEDEEEQETPKKSEEPMEVDDEIKQNTIIEVNNTKQPRMDPRLRSKKQQRQQQQPSTTTTTTTSVEKSVSQLQEEELMYKAQLQLKALKDMEMKQKHLEEAQKQAMHALSKAHESKAPSKIQMQWKKKKTNS